MSKKKDDQVNTNAEKQAEEKENQELVALTLEEAETEAELIKKKAERETQNIINEALANAEKTQHLADKEAEKILTEANQVKSDAENQAKGILASGETFVKELKNAKYIAVDNIKEDGKDIKKGTAYNGKDSKIIKRLLEIGAIKVNK